MIEFLTPTPDLHFVEYHKLAVTCQDYRWRDEDGIERVLFRGFPTDGASLPWIVTCRWNPWDAKILKHALPHDGAYCLHNTEHDLGTKDVADLRFRRGLSQDHFEASKIFWLAVHWFGLRAWNKPDNRLMGGYLWALRSGTPDEWLEHCRMMA